MINQLPFFLFSIPIPVAHSIQGNFLQLATLEFTAYD